MSCEIPVNVALATRSHIRSNADTLGYRNKVVSHIAIASPTYVPTHRACASYVQCTWRLPRPSVPMNSYKPPHKVLSVSSTPYGVVRNARSICVTGAHAHILHSTLIPSAPHTLIHDSIPHVHLSRTKPTAPSTPHIFSGPSTGHYVLHIFHTAFGQTRILISPAKHPIYTVKQFFALAHDPSIYIFKTRVHSLPIYTTLLEPPMPTSSTFDTAARDIYR